MAIDPGVASGFCKPPGCTYNPDTGVITPIVKPPPPPPPTGGPELGFPPCTPGHQGKCVSGGKVLEGVGEGGIDPFTEAVLVITGIGIGGQLGGVVGAGIGEKVTKALVASGGDLSAAVNSLLPSAAGGLLDIVLSQGLQPDLLPPEQRGALGVGGLGGGALTPAPYLRATGELTGALLRGHRIKLKNLLAGGQGVAGALLRSIL